MVNCLSLAHITFLITNLVITTNVKNDLQKLEEKYHGNKNNDDEVPKIRISKNSLKNDWVKNKRSATDRSSNLRLAIILAILVGLVAYFFELHTLF